MKFSVKLRQAMQELNLTQAQVVGLTGKSKASVSQYLSDAQVPPEKVQKDIAVSIGLSPDYFEEKEPVIKLARQGWVIPELKTKDAAKLMRMSRESIEAGLRQGEFEWGYAIRTSPHRHRYFINARRFAAIEMIDVPPDMIC